MIKNEAEGKYLRIDSRSINQQMLDIAYRDRLPITHAMPSKIWIEPTNACNAHCPLCPTGTGESTRQKSILPIASFIKIVNEIAPFTQSMNLWDLGEPFLHPQIFTMIRYAEDKNIRTRISTNGTVFYHSDNADAILASKLSDLIVSLDGASQKTFERYRIGIDFDRVIEGLRKLMSLKQLKHSVFPNVVWQFIAMKHNQDEIEIARTLALSLGMVFSLKTVNLDMINNKKDKTTFLPNDLNLSRYNTIENEKYTLKKQRQNECKLLWYSLMVNADGYVIPCCYDYSEDLILGQVFRQSIKEIWDGVPMQLLRNRIQENRMSIPPCKVCSEGKVELLFSEGKEKEDD